MNKNFKRSFIMGVNSVLGSIYTKEDGTKIVFFHSPEVNIEEGFYFWDGKTQEKYEDLELLEYIKDFLG